MIPADKQKVFDIVWWHLRKQRRKASPADGLGCWYRTSDGLTCAIGCMIPEGHPSHDFGGRVDGLRAKYPELFEPGCDLDLLSDLQSAHDYAPDGKFRRQLEIVARKHHLTTPLQRGEKAPVSP